MRRTLATLLLAAVLLGACADDGGDASPAPTSTSSSTTAPSTTPPSSTDAAPPTTDGADTLTVQVFFLDEDAFNIGRLPYVRPVERVVPTDGAEAAALDALFEGPTADEAAGGVRFVASEATGVGEFELVDGTAHVHLAGGCSSGGSTFTVANQIVPTLVQFTSVDAVKIYDPDGQTGSPDEPGDSIPFCLEP